FLDRALHVLQRAILQLRPRDRVHGSPGQSARSTTVRRPSSNGLVGRIDSSDAPGDRASCNAAKGEIISAWHGRCSSTQELLVLGGARPCSIRRLSSRRDEPRFSRSTGSWSCLSPSTSPAAGVSV